MASSQSTELESVDFEKDTVAAGVVVNKFSNDGSFLEMFKKKMEEEQRRKSTESKEKTETADSPDPSASVTETESSEGSKKPSFYSFVRTLITGFSRFSTALQYGFFVIVVP